MTRALVLCGGSPHAHDFDGISRALTQVLGPDTTIVAHPDDFARRLSEPWDLAVVHALWWRMLGGSYDEWRDQWGYSTTEHTASAITEYVADGGSILSLHTAPICFDDWPEWGDILGGGWQWGTSSHPPKGPLEIHITGKHPITEGLPETIALSDEVYGDLRMSPRAEVLAVARRHPNDDDQPMVWTHRFGNGHVAHIGVAHDEHTITHPLISKLITRAASWLTQATPVHT